MAKPAPPDGSKVTKPAPSGDSAAKPPPGGLKPGSGKFAPLDLTPGGLCLTVNAPPGAAVTPATTAGVLVRKGKGFRLEVRPHDEVGKAVLDHARKTIRGQGVDVVEDTETALVFGTKVGTTENYRCFVLVKAGGETYLCSAAGGALEEDLTKAQAVQIAECAKSLTRTAANRRSEARMREAIARFNELDSCRFNPTTLSLKVEGGEAGDADLALAADVPQTKTVVLSARKLTPAGLKHLRSLPNLTWVILQGKAVTDEWLASLRSLHLEKLTVDGTAITSAGWEHLKGLPALGDLMILGQPADDAALRAIAGVPALTELRLKDVRLSDAGLKHLAALKKLTVLHLNENPVTDAGLEHLAKLKQLYVLDLDDTKVTRAGVQKLKKELPGCSISSNAK